MRLCLLTDENIDDFNPAVYFEKFDWEFLTVKEPVMEFITELAHSRQHDVYINIYEGIDDDENSGLRFVQALERLGLPFTGADSKFYEVTREQMQSAAEAAGLAFARGLHAELLGDLTRAEALNFPLIVKHPNSFASTGLTKDSRVTNFIELKDQFKRMVDAFGSARIEEFIEGREMSCLVVENSDDPFQPHVYPPAEVQFPAGETFLHEDAKWNRWDIYVVRLQDDTLARRIQEVARKFFIAMDGCGYARIDLRVRPGGAIVLLEINPNCGVLYYGPDDRSHSDLAIKWNGGHDLFLERIVRAAIKRQNKGMRASKNPTA